MNIASKRLQAKLALLVFGAFVLVACSPAPMPVSQSSKDPSNPNAAEGVPPVVPVIQSAAATASAHVGHDHHGAVASEDAGAVTYVCPMHPEVSSSAPGVCPRCNMKLVPKK